jgi:oligoribonuclease NrnB/cAMP/cGMP phosphodiesterase (DHH superfamily)
MAFLREDERTAAVLTHSRDLDGIASAAILARYLEGQGKDVKVDFVDYATQNEDLQRLRSLTETDIYIADFAFDEPEHYEVFNEIVAKGNRVAYWNDHHPHKDGVDEAITRYAEITDLCGPQPYCSAEIAQQRYLPNDTVARELAELAHDNDFWERKVENANKLADVIASGYDKNKLVSLLKHGETWNPELEQVWKAYDTRRNESYGRLDDRAEITQYGMTSCVISLADDMLATSDAGDYLLNKYDTEMSVTLYRDGRMAFRRAEGGEVDLTDVARMFGGGGHPYASGAQLDEEIPDDDAYAYACDIVDSKLAEYFMYGL